jgi:hypothetical protein
MKMDEIIHEFPIILTWMKCDIIQKYIEGNEKVYMERITHKYPIVHRWMKWYLSLRMNEKITITEINKTRFQMNLLNKIYVT